MAFHLFSPEMAQRYGLIEGILIQHLQHWIGRNKARNQNNFDEHTWTYNSVQSFTKVFTYLTTKQIRVALDNLIERGVLLRGNYNRTGYDRTAWYCFADEAAFLPCVECPCDDTQSFAPEGTSICPTGQMEVPDKANGIALEGEPIPDNYQYNYQREKRADEAAVATLPAIKKSRQTASRPAEPICKRREDFRKQMLDFKSENPQLYPIPFYELFFSYWTQPSSQGVMKFEAERYFGIDVRMNSFWRRVSDAEKRGYWDEHNEWMRHAAQKPNKQVNDLIKHIIRSPQPELF